MNNCSIRSISKFFRNNKVIKWFKGVQMARKTDEKDTKPVFGQSTKTSINLDSFGYLITLFIVGKNTFYIGFMILWLLSLLNTS